VWQGVSGTGNLDRNERGRAKEGVRVEDDAGSFCSLHGFNLVLGSEATLDAWPDLSVRLPALVPDGLLEGAALALLAVSACIIK
jgi:hypothetical protein